MCNLQSGYKKRWSLICPTVKETLSLMLNKITMHYFAAEDLIYIIDGHHNWVYFVGFIEQLLPKLYAGHFNFSSLAYMDNFYGKK